MNVKFFRTQKDFRKWLEVNHDSKTELWVGYYKKDTGKPSITWPQSVDEALCFGWIDGIRKSIDKESYCNRFTPRRPKSIWSNVNTKRICELIELGLVHKTGVEAFKRKDEKRSGIYSFERENAKLNKEAELKFKANNKAWNFFQSQSLSYKKTAVFWVMSAKQEATRLKRLQILIDDSEHELKIGPLRRLNDKK